MEKGSNSRNVSVIKDALGLPELINTATNMVFTENSKAKHKKDAMYGKEQEN